MAKFEIRDIASIHMLISIKAFYRVAKRLPTVMAAFILANRGLQTASFASEGERD